jgi:hypothetical protein
LSGPLTLWGTFYSIFGSGLLKNQFPDQLLKQCNGGEVFSTVAINKKKPAMKTCLSFFLSFYVN